MKPRYTMGIGRLNVESDHRWTLQEDGRPVLMSCESYPTKQAATAAGIAWTMQSGLMKVEVTKPKPAARLARRGKP